MKAGRTSENIGDHPFSMPASSDQHRDFGARGLKERQSLVFSTAADSSTEKNDGKQASSREDRSLSKSRVTSANDVSKPTQP